MSTQDTQALRARLLEKCESIRQNTTGIVARHLNKRLSLPISRWIVLHTRWTPNQITYANIVLGLISGLVASRGTLPALFLAGLLFQIVSVIDGVDGEVAKLTQNFSPWGQWLDTLSDNGSLVCFLTGTVIGVHHLDPQGPFLSLAITTGGAIFFLIGTMLIFLRRETTSGSLVTYDKEFLSTITPDEFPVAARLIHTLKYAIKKDVYSLVFFAACLVGEPGWILYLCAYGGLAGCLFLAYVHIMKWMDRTCEPFSISYAWAEPPRRLR